MNAGERFKKRIDELKEELKNENLMEIQRGDKACALVILELHYRRFEEETTNEME